MGASLSCRSACHLQRRGRGERFIRPHGIEQHHHRRTCGRKCYGHVRFANGFRLSHWRHQGCTGARRHLRRYRQRAAGWCCALSGHPVVTRRSGRDRWPAHDAGGCLRAVRHGDTAGVASSRAFDHHTVSRWCGRAAFRRETQDVTNPAPPHHTPREDPPWKVTAW